MHTHSSTLQALPPDEGLDAAGAAATTLLAETAAGDAVFTVDATCTGAGADCSCMVDAKAVPADEGLSAPGDEEADAVTAGALALMNVRNC